MAIEDPNDLERVDMEIRRNELTEQGAELFIDEECPPALESEFYDYIQQYEEAPLASWIERLERIGYHPPAPAALSEEEISAELQTLIARLADLHVFVVQTNHLSDRELYTHLVLESLVELEKDLGVQEDLVYHMDILGGCSEEDIEIWLKYYASETDRQDWARDFGDQLPERAPPPFDRDRSLPKPPF